MTEFITVVPAPDGDALVALGDPAPLVPCVMQRGVDAAGRARLRITLTHPDAVVVAEAREAWLRALRSIGVRAFVV